MKLLLNQTVHCNHFENNRLMPGFHPLNGTGRDVGPLMSPISAAEAPVRKRKNGRGWGVGVGVGESHEPSFSPSCGDELRDAVQEQRPICTWAPAGLSGEQNVCVLRLFLCPAGGRESPDPGKADKCAFHWPRTHEKWSCCEGGAQIAASDCSADKTETVAGTKIISLFGIRRSPLAS